MYYTPSKPTTPPKPKGISQNDLIDVIWNAESARGTNLPNNLDVNTSLLDAVNKNDKPVNFNYNNIYARQFGLTPVAVGEVANRRANRDNPQGNINGPTNFLDDRERIKNAFNNGTTTTGGIASEYFNMEGRRLQKENPQKYNFDTVDGLTNIYMDGYLKSKTEGKANPNYTQKNRDRIRGYFTEKLTKGN